MRTYIDINVILVQNPRLSKPHYDEAKIFQLFLMKVALIFRLT